MRRNVACGAWSVQTRIVGAMVAIVLGFHGCEEAYPQTNLNSIVLRGYIIGAATNGGGGSTDPVPASRLPVAGNWVDSVGVSNGIPQYTTIFSNFNADAYGTNVTHLNAALSACPSGQVVFLNAGTYNFNSYVVQPKSYTVLRGATNSAGVPTTILKFNSMGGAEAGYWLNDSSDTFDPTQTGNWTALSVTSGIARGSTSLSVSGSLSSLVISNIVWLLSPTNQTQTGVTGPYNNAQFLGSNPFAVALKPTAISGSTVTFTPPLNADFLSNNVCKLCWISPHQIIHRSGIENVYLQRPSGTGGSYIWAQGGDECWLRNVYEYDLPFGVYGVSLWCNYRFEIRHCDFSYAECSSDCSSTYAIYPYFNSCALIEDNVFHNMPNPMPIKGLQSSVFAYNCIDNLPYASDPGWLSQVVYFHGQFCAYNLFEGNFGVTHYHDGGDGPNTDNCSGSMNNLFFRERLAGYDTSNALSGGASDQNLSCFTAGRYGNWNMVAGCVLGTKTGWDTSGYTTLYTKYQTNIYPDVISGTIFNLSPHITNTFIDIDNWNTVDAGIHSGTGLTGSQALVTSYLHSTKPAWWGSSQPWPPFGPENAAGVTNNLSYTNIPAGYRYVHGTDPL